MRTVSIPAQVHLGPLGSRRLLVIASDNTLVGQMRRGNEAAFSVAFERHAIGLLGFCRHMVGSPEDAEDAVQHTFLAAFRDLAHSRERKLALKPWLYAIARNRCLSMLRARREQTALDFDLPTEGLTEEVERRAEVSLETVQSHVKHILRKLGVHSRAEAIERAQELRRHRPASTPE